MTRHLTALVPLILITAGCACESGIGISGDTGSDSALSDTTDTPDDPDPGDFAPSIDGLGDPGWEESDDPWYPDNPHTYGSAHPLDVWSTPGSVFVLTGNNNYDHATGDPYEDLFIWRNSGTGWSQWFEYHGSYHGGCYNLLGSAENRLLLHARFPMSGCSLTIVDAGGSDCAFLETGEVRDVFVVNEDLAYAIKDDRLIYFDGTSWGPYPAVSPPYSVDNIWADETEIFCTGEDGTVISLEDGDWRIHDTRTLGNIGEVWGFGSDDIWVIGGDTGLMHWDGTEWSTVTWPEAPRFDVFEAITGLWGSEDGVLFIQTGNYLIKHDGTGFTMLLDLYPDFSLQIAAIWGNHAEELFVALSDGDYETGSGSQFLLWYDGTEFHWF